MPAFGLILALAVLFAALTIAYAWWLAPVGLLFIALTWVVLQTLGGARRVAEAPARAQPDPGARGTGRVPASAGPGTPQARGSGEASGTV